MQSVDGIASMLAALNTAWGGGPQAQLRGPGRRPGAPRVRVLVAPPALASAALHTAAVRGRFAA
eukprot:200697-Lingulodinium_polyedra.AAC.1